MRIPGLPIPLRCFAEDFMISNPQFARLNYRAILNHSNYNALQAQVTARPINGISIQATWAWAKSMQLSTDDYLDPANRSLDFGVETKHPTRSARMEPSNCPSVPTSCSLRTRRDGWGEPWNTGR
jgi:hypothetical protein